MAKNHLDLETTLKATLQVASQQEVTARLALMRVSSDAPASVARDISNLTACLTKSMSTMQRALNTFLEKPTVRRWIEGEADEVAAIVGAVSRKGLTATQLRALLAAALEEDAEEGEEPPTATEVPTTDH